MKPNGAVWRADARQTAPKVVPRPKGEQLFWVRFLPSLWERAEAIICKTIF